MITDQQRKAFEQWAEKHFLVLDKAPDDAYIYNSTHFCWAGWQAAQQVKPLTWVKHGDEWLAQTGFGIYQLKKDADGFWEVRIDIGVTNLLLITEPLDTIEKAIELANKDYQRRVLGCLVNGVTQ